MAKKPTEFSDTNKAGRAYMATKPQERRSPRRDKQVARGKGFDQTARAALNSAREAMGHGRQRKDWGQK